MPHPLQPSPLQSSPRPNPAHTPLAHQATSTPLFFWVFLPCILEGYPSWVELISRKHWLPAPTLAAVATQHTAYLTAHTFTLAQGHSNTAGHSLGTEQQRHGTPAKGTSTQNHPSAIQGVCNDASATNHP